METEDPSEVRFKEGPLRTSEACIFFQKKYMDDIFMFTSARTDFHAFLNTSEESPDDSKAL